MPVITDIQPQKRRKNRVNIYLDGVFAFGLSLQTAVSFGLKTDMRLTDEEVESIVKESDYAEALDKTLKFLSFRPRSERELMDYLKRRELGEYAQELILEKLAGYGYVDDKAFAEWWIGQRKDFKPRSRRHIVSELMRKGVSRGVIEDALSSSGDDFDLNACRTVAEKRWRTYQKFPPREARMKLGQYLSRKGFSWEIIEKVVNGFLSSK